jgi:hemolysin activation/secretion protein
MFFDHWVGVFGALDTTGGFTKLNLSFNSTLAFTEKLSLSTTIMAQKSLMGSLDSSEQMGLTGYWGVRSFDERLAGDSGYLVTPELKYALPDLRAFRHSIGVFFDTGAVWLENAVITMLQKSHTQLNDGALARAFRQLSQQSTATNWNAERKFLAVLS